MEVATVMAIVQTILTAIQVLEQLRHTFSFSHYEKQLQRLFKTVNAIQSVLQDADAMRGVLNHQEIYYIEELKDAVYDADDLLDEFLTLVKRKKLNGASPKPLDKVNFYICRFTQQLSKKLNDVNEKLAVIASDAKFMFKIHYNPIKFIKPESSSFACSKELIIGRGDDLEKIVGMLLESDDVNGSSVAIVGMGGLGKTAFAQLVYNDPRVKSAFQLKCWACIGDHEQWNLVEVLGKIVKGLFVGNTRDLTSLEQMQDEVRKKVQGEKYLLVLDDVWTERYHEWEELKKLLRVGGSGSRIVVTTRSKKTAQNIEGVRVHELQGLSDDESWCLFEMMAFQPHERENPVEDLINIGKAIVKKCINVPLAIRILGSYFRSKPRPEWQSFLDKELANISKGDHTMHNILSLSYNHLDFPLKSCFTYCSIFPKGFEIKKQQLIRLWMAQGYINEEYKGEEYFCLLLQRCFFQDVKEDITVEIRSFKIHDLLHDIAEQKSGKEICRLNSNLINVDIKVRHLNLLNASCPQGTLSNTYIRTLLNVRGSWHDSHRVLAESSIRKWTCLRSLELSGSPGTSLPESIGQLFHLRYLDLSWSGYLEVLPNSITKLVNLQTLNLGGCTSLTKLPEDIYKLVDLSTLDITYCENLSLVSLNLGMLTNLHTLLTTRRTRQ